MAKATGKYDSVILEILEEDPACTKGGLVKALQKRAEITGGNAYQALRGALGRGVIDETEEGLQVGPGEAEGPTKASPKAGSNGVVGTGKPKKGKPRKVVDTVPVTFTVDLPKGPVTLTTTLSMKKLMEVDRILRE